ncbi:hypothetical protein [Staphylococcus epidermidis]|uniref:hypothetical protein n=1 Tax=Staphylococcus epidermidis TaxID=1282 RepID=UPI00164332A7|nr:hypothetical protein [Staphylococcus epidermidis]
MLVKNKYGVEGSGGKLKELEEENKGGEGDRQEEMDDGKGVKEELKDMEVEV